MRNFAVLNGSNVSNVIVAEDHTAAASVLPDALLIEVTQETGPAYIGGDIFNGRFRAASPYPSWLWDSQSWSWASPVPYPNDGEFYVWDESGQVWVLYIEPDPEHAPVVDADPSS